MFPVGEGLAPPETLDVESSPYWVLLLKRTASCIEGFGKGKPLPDTENNFEKSCAG